MGLIDPSTGNLASEVTQAYISHNREENEDLWTKLFDKVDQFVDQNVDSFDILEPPKSRKETKQRFEEEKRTEAQHKEFHEKLHEMVNFYLGVHDDSDEDGTPSPARRGVKTKFLSIKKFRQQVKNVMKKNK